MAVEAGFNAPHQCRQGRIWCQGCASQIPSGWRACTWGRGGVVRRGGHWYRLAYIGVVVRSLSSSFCRTEEEGGDSQAKKPLSTGTNLEFAHEHEVWMAVAEVVGFWEKGKEGCEETQFKVYAQRRACFADKVLRPLARVEKVLAVVVVRRVAQRALGLREGSVGVKVGRWRD